MDVSKSVSLHDYDLQRDGMIAALADPEVRDLFLRPGNHVTVLIYHWSGSNYQGVVSDWREVREVDDLIALSRDIETHLRYARNLPTSIGAALEFGRQAMEDAPDCGRRVIDVAGDGRSNDGMSPEQAYAWEDFGDITVNGLAIGGHEAGLVDYYKSEVIRGPGAFVEVAGLPEDFARTLKRKLVRELAEQVSLLDQSPANSGG